jgi:hypothetical protein
LGFLFPVTILNAAEVMDVVEICLTSSKEHKNPYLDVDCWVTLSGPNKENYLIPTFWDGGRTFRARLVATAPGNWKWSTGDQTGDPGLDQQSGAFDATAPSESEKIANPNKRGFIRAHQNGHTLEYADGTPFFYTADTVWTALTKIFSWDSPTGKAGISFQDYFASRKAQGFNGVNVIASYPTDSVPEKGIWAGSVKGEKVSENGLTPFLISGDEADYTRINPDYWREVDPKMKFLADNGFVTFFESVRRHEQWPQLEEKQRDAFTEYTRYLWARYGCYNMIYSWLHWDTDRKVYPAWLPLLVKAHEELKAVNGTGRMPYEQPMSAMAYGSSLDTWGKDAPFLLTVHNVSNLHRDQRMFPWLRKIYRATPALPAFNAEPYYPGSAARLPEGKLTIAQMAEFQMYGSVLNGGFAGHAWGDTYFAGVAYWTDGTVTRDDPQRNALGKWGSSSMGSLKKFVLDPGHDYRRLHPASDTHLDNSQGDMHSLAITDNDSLALGFYTTGYPVALVTGIQPDKDYKFEWWDVGQGVWLDSITVKSSKTGTLSWPAIPDPSRNWAYRILMSE